MIYIYNLIPRYKSPPLYFLLLIFIHVQIFLFTNMLCCIQFFSSQDKWIDIGYGRYRSHNQYTWLSIEPYIKKYYTFDITL